MQQLRRVRTVRLAAAEEALVRRGAILLEDALHVASLPAIETGRVLVIRSLQVGRINVLQPSTSAALTIEERVRALASTAIHAGDPAAGTAPAVYFRNDAEPFILLAMRLARQLPVDDWFWAPAVPVWRRDLGRDDSLRTVLHGSARTRAGPAATLSLLEELHRRSALGPLLTALRWTDGPELLRTFGWRVPARSFPPAVGKPAGTYAAVSPAWGQTLARWAGQWGGNDPRSLWLAAAALAVERPARLLDERLPARAQRLLQAVSKTSVSSPNEAASPHLDLRGPPAPPAEDAAPRHGRSPADEQHGEHEPLSKEAGGSSGIEPAVQFSAPPSVSAGPTEAAELDLPVPRTGVRPARTAVGEDGTAEAPSPHMTGERAPRVWTEPRPTTYAGLFLLLPALARLGLAQTLAAYPALLELDLPDRILREVGRRLRLPAADPVLAVPFVARAGAPRVREFVAPGRWFPTLAAEGDPLLRPVRGRSGSRVLYDASGRLPLACWQGRAPLAAHTLLGGSPVRRATPVRRAGGALVLAAWMEALRRWCRLYAGMSVREVVQRPGEIVLSRTHLDVLFDPRAIDIRIRKAGLDLDPGWIPWFGRVVSFHYRYEDDDGIQ